MRTVNPPCLPVVLNNLNTLLFPIHTSNQHVNLFYSSCLFVNKIYNFKTGCVKTECLQEGWQTSGSEKIVRIAFNLYTDGTPTTDEYKDTEAQITETRLYSISDIFCTGYARYFWEAIKIRYPDYCFYVDWEDMFYAED